MRTARLANVDWSSVYLLEHRQAGTGLVILYAYVPGLPPGLVAALGAAAIGAVSHGTRVTISDGISLETIWDFAERPLIGAGQRARTMIGAVA